MTPSSENSTSYLLEASGMGLGDELESFEFVSIDGGAADCGSLTYGSLVAIKVSRAKERYWYNKMMMTISFFL